MGTPSGERETLEQLRGDEAALEREIAEARREAASLVESARREAERLVAEARRDAERERDRLRAAGAELDEALARAEEDARACAAELGRRAERNRERAVARALRIVLGSGP